MRLLRAATAALLLAVLGTSSHVADAAPAGAPPRHPCLYDPASRQLRRCLHFSFGRCYAWGDRCQKRSQ